jgi:hypothetical protein
MDIGAGTVHGSMEDGVRIGAMVGAGMILGMLAITVGMILGSTTIMAGMILGTMIGAGAILIMATGAGVAMVPIGATGLITV